MSSPVTVCHQEFDESHFLASEYEPARPEQAAFHIIPVPLEQSVSYGGGTAHGPAAILSASQQLEAWDGISAPGEAGLYTAPAVDCDAPIETVLDRIEAATAHALRCKALPVILGKRRGLRLPLRMTTCGPFDARRAEAGAKGEPWQFFKGSSTSSGRLVFARQAFLGRRGGRATVFGREIVRALNLRPIGPAADEASGEERGSAGWRGERGHGAGHSGAAEAVCGGGSDVPRRWAHRAARRNLA